MNITDQIIMPERDNESEITNKIRMVGRQVKLIDILEKRIIS